MENNPTQMNEYGVTFCFSKVIMRVEEAGSKKKILDFGWHENLS